MGKILFIIIISSLLVISSCSTTRKGRSLGVDSRQEKKLAQQAIVKEAVETRRYIIKLYSYYLVYADTRTSEPTNGVIIVDGETFNSCFIGRNGYSKNGEIIEYKLKSDPIRRKYEIEMKVNLEGEIFEVSLKIENDGSCSAYVPEWAFKNYRAGYIKSSKIAAYQGHLSPIKERTVLVN